MKFRVFKTEKEFISETIKYFTEICRKTLSEKTTINIALSGGKTPEKIYRALSKTDLPFRKMEFFLIDERYVHLTDANSNYKMIHENLFRKNSFPENKPKAFHFFDTALSTKTALEKYERELKKVTFDLAILGIGEDGHIASLFPKSEVLKEKKHLTALTTTNIFAVKKRLTITLPKLKKSKNILILLKGKEKKEISEQLKLYARGKKKPSHAFPASLLPFKKIRLHFFTD